MPDRHYTSVRHAWNDVERGTDSGSGSSSSSSWNSIG